MVTVRLRQNGPIVIESDEVSIVDWNGDAYAIDRRPVALCRCGGSARKPFCDKSHARIQFDGSQAARPTSDGPS